MLAGGGALLTGLDERMRHETHMPVHGRLATCVAVGSGKSLEEFEVIHRSQRNRGATGAGRTAGSDPPYVVAVPQASTLRTPRASPPLAGSGRSYRPDGGLWLPREEPRRPGALSYVERRSSASSSSPSRCSACTSASPRAAPCTDAGRRRVGHPPSRSPPSASRNFEDVFGWAGDVLGAESENEKLKQEVERLRQQLVQSQAALLQNERLRKLLALPGRACLPARLQRRRRERHRPYAWPVRAAGADCRRVERPRARERPGRHGRWSRRPRDADLAAQRSRHPADRRDERGLGSTSRRTPQGSSGTESPAARRLSSTA